LEIVPFISTRDDFLISKVTKLLLGDLVNMPLAKGTSSGSRSPADASRRPAKKRITDEEWLSHKEPIGRLYLDEGKDVRDVRDTMRREYGFEAQYVHGAMHSG